MRGDSPSLQTLEMQKSFSFLAFSVFLTALRHKTAITLQPFIAQSKNGRLQPTKNGGFPENRHVSFIGPYRPTSIQQSKKFLYVLVGYFILILKKCMKRVLRASSSQCSPQIMHAWGRMRNFYYFKKNMWV